jgi:hypothetical protein
MLFQNPGRTSQEAHCVYATQASRLILVRERIAVYYEGLPLAMHLCHSSSHAHATLISHYDLERRCLLIILRFFYLRAEVDIYAGAPYCHVLSGQGKLEEEPALDPSRCVFVSGVVSLGQGRIEIRSGTRAFCPLVFFAEIIIS